MSSIIENLQLAAQQVHLINLYQANSEVVYTGYIDRLAPDGVVVNTYDDAGLQDGAVFMRYDVIDEVEMMSEDLDNMAFRLKNATTEGLNSVPQPALAIDDQQPALAQLVDHAHSDHQVVLLVLADNDNYLEGQVQAITDQTITFTTFDKFDFKNKTQQVIPLDSIQILEFCGNELLLESAFVKTAHAHQETVKVSEPDDVDATLNNALAQHQLIAIRSADGSDMFFVGFINTLNADSVLLNLIDMTGQFGGYTLCRRSLIESVTTQSDYLQTMRGFIELNRQYELNVQPVLNDERLFDGTTDLFESILRQAATFNNLVHITTENPMLPAMTGYPGALTNGHFIFYNVDDDNQINHVGTMIELDQVVELSFGYMDAYLLEKRLKSTGNL
ncbi:MULTISPECIES: hypothetical protein [Lactiplantibacillus]|jgi:hypothetical protein|uniref:Uncharacterized protein n=4 Tax=Lactiplantibacillus pentosus TaxID=1589 RepID=A0A241RNN5_LACPE|nr:MULTISPECIES: hypothetical protein [Lactiplantibacillus]CCC16746.1 putative uncharacterized protein lp_0340 [Lactiplantibacillus pentosus IG1]BBM21385.1 hypothetical protein SN13T_1420 [Lactiplantibacillus plantarum]ASG79519.1 hypothetical protein CEW82_06580 [Lactiplantibacillus pentosus]AYJ40737.1 hypothetical protein LP314_01845 [Lactiplantibacillus pentosus]KRK25794.1 hypothetical protein FD24_GL002938 [Lactiplantibacillus pentosus DSM 20314]